MGFMSHLLGLTQNYCASSERSSQPLCQRFWPDNMYLKPWLGAGHGWVDGVGCAISDVWCAACSFASMSFVFDASPMQTCAAYQPSNTTSTNAGSFCRLLQSLRSFGDLE